MRTISTVQAQRGVDVEIIVVDDGSADDTAREAGGLDRVSVVRHERSRGVAAARNAGIRAAAGEWVAFLDDDDLWAGDKLAEQLAAATSGGVDWAFSHAISVNERGEVLEPHLAPPADEIRDKLFYLNTVPAGASNVVARRTALVAAGGFDEDLQHFADWGLWLRLAQAGPPVVVDAVHVAYVRHATNMHAAGIESARDEWRCLGDKVYASTGRHLHPQLVHGWIAEGHGRMGRHWRAAAVFAAVGVRWPSRMMLRAARHELALAIRLATPRDVVQSAAPAWACVDAVAPPARRVGPPVG